MSDYFTPPKAASLVTIAGVAIAALGLLGYRYFDLGLEIGSAGAFLGLSGQAWGKWARLRWHWARADAARRTEAE